jgi:hypothetical protein
MELLVEPWPAFFMPRCMTIEHDAVTRTRRTALKNRPRSVQPHSLRTILQIAVISESDGRRVVAADAGDYIYPADVRIAAVKERLYLRASGYARGSLSIPCEGAIPPPHNT